MIYPSINFSRLTNGELSWIQGSAAGNVELNEVSVPSGTASGRGILYVLSSDSQLRYQDDSGTVVNLSTAGGGAPTNAQYVTLALNGTLTAERVLTGTSNQISIVDGGADGNVTLSLPQDINATATIQAGTVRIGGYSLTLDATTRISSFGSTLVNQSSAANARTYLGLAIGSNVQAWDTQLDDIAGLSPTASTFIEGDGSNFVSRTAANVRGDLGLVIGTNVQAFDSDLSDIAALTQTASSYIASDGSNWIRRSAAQVRGDLSLVVGTNVQAFDSDLSDIAALSQSASTFIESNGVNWISRTVTNVRGDLGLIIGTNVQAWDAQLDDVAGLTAAASAIILGNGSNFITQTGAAFRNSINLGTASSVQFGYFGVGTTASSTSRVEVFGSIVSEMVSIAVGTTVVISWASANVHTVNLNPGGTTSIVWATTSLVSGQVLVLSVRQPSLSAALNVVWPSTVRWPSGTAPTISTGTAKTDVFAFVRHGSDNVEYANTVGQNYAQ